jgi:phosphatidate cytidylyltransferase
VIELGAPPPVLWPLAARIAVLICLEAVFAVAVKRLRRGPAASRASIWRRAATWIGIGIVTFAACGFGPVTFALLVSTIAVAAIRELVAVLAAAGRPASLPLALAGGVGTIVAAVAGGAQLVGVATFVVGVASLFEGVAQRSWRRGATLFAAAAYVGLPLALLVALRRADAGFATVTWTIAIVAFCDVTSMFGGLAFGRRKLAPSLSPNKTLEGTAVGLLGALVAAAALRFAFPQVPTLAYGAAAVVVASSGIAGDLFASLLKRAAIVKDFGSALPGHGGVMDRIDSLLFAAPVAWMFFTLLV